MNKVLIKLLLPVTSEQYEVWIPLNKKVYDVILLLMKGINDINHQDYEVNDIPILYNKLTGLSYDFNTMISDTDIKNGTELIMI